MKHACILLGIFLVNFPSCREAKEPATPPPVSPRATVAKPNEDEATKPKETQETTTSPEPSQPEETPSPPPGQPPEGVAPSEPSATTPSAPKPKEERQVEIIRYDPAADLDLVAYYLNKINGLLDRRRYNDMRVYVARLSRTLVYLEGHLPTVAMQVGLERVQALLTQDQPTKAASEARRVLSEIRSLPALAPSGDVVTALNDLAENLEGGGDVDTARDALSEIRVSFSSPTDPSALILEIRSSLTSLEIAVSRESPQVIRAQLETLRELLGKLRRTLSPATPATKPPTTPSSTPSVKPPSALPAKPPSTSAVQPPSAPAAKPPSTTATKPPSAPATQPAR